MAYTRRTDTTARAVLAGEHGSIVSVTYAALALDLNPGSLIRAQRQSRAPVPAFIGGGRPRWNVNALRAAHGLPPLSLDEFAAADRTGEAVPA